MIRAVKEEKLDGFVVLLDDSNMHSMEFFDEIQNVKWLGAVCVGIMANAEEMVTSMKEEDWKSAVYIDDIAVVLPQRLEWSGFVVNSSLLWEEGENKPRGWVVE